MIANLISSIDYKPLSYYLTSDFMLPIILKALAVGLLVCLCCSLLGVTLVLKRFSMIGDGLSHTGFGALAIATVLGATGSAYHITMPIVVIAAFLLLRTGENSKIHGDTAIAVLSTGAVAFGSLLYNFSNQRYQEICTSLFGSAGIFTISNTDLLFSILVSVAVLILFVLFYNRIFAITFDETFAGSAGINSSVYRSLIAVLTAVTVVVGMKMMGSIMISGLIIFPALSAMRICKSFKGVVVCSVATGVFCFLAGFSPLFASAFRQVRRLSCSTFLHFCCSRQSASCATSSPSTRAENCRFQSRRLRDWSRLPLFSRPLLRWQSQLRYR